MNSENSNVRILIEEYLENARMMQVATAINNQPWACTVYFAYDKGLHLYWISEPTTRHSEEIRKNKKVAGTIVLAHQWMNGVFIGIISALLGQAIFFYVLEKGELSITATIISTYSIYTILFSILFLGEILSAFTFVFIGLTVLGTIIVTWPERVDKKEINKVRNILWAVLAAVCIGGADTITKYYIDVSSVGSFLFFVSFAQLFISLLYLKFAKQSLYQLTWIITKYKDYSFALLGSLFVAIATMFLFLSFNFTLASIASPIVASAPIVTVVFALFFLKEKISGKNWVGLTFVLIGIIGIGFVTG